jgi:hypothetical protein
LLDWRFLTNLNISYSLLAIVLIPRSLGLPNPHPNSVPVLHEILHHNFKRGQYDCRRGSTKIESWCNYGTGTSSIMILCQNNNDPTQTSQFLAFCLDGYECVGSGKNPPDDPNQSRSADCVSRNQDFWRQDSNSIPSGALYICSNFNPQTSDTGKVSVQVLFDSEDPNPPIPDAAQLYYVGASYPIQTILQAQMDTTYGSFAFYNPFDASQLLSLCITGIPTGLGFIWAFQSYGSSTQGVGCIKGNVTYDNVEG